MSNNNSNCASIIDYQNQPLGTLYIIHGLFYYPFYVPCVFAIFTQPLISSNCYQIMGPMAVLDLINLSVGALLSGYWSIIGFSYCRNYISMKVFCAIMNGSWTCYCALCVTLGINRMLEMGGSVKTEEWFLNGKTLYWVVGCFLYGASYTVLYMTPLATLAYDSKIGVYMFDPIKNNTLAIIVNCFNNIGTLTLLVILYSMVAIRTKELTNTMDNGQVTTEQLSAMKTKRTITYQCFFVCVSAGLTCLFYSTIPLITEQVWAFQLTNLFWQMTQGSNGIIYITLNKTIRQRVIAILSCRSSSVAPVPVTATHPVHNNAVIEENF